MIEENKFKPHLLTIEPEQWDRLFQLLPEIEKTNVFGIVQGGNILENGSIQMSYWSWSNIVSDFLDIFYDINLCIIFDWGSWTEGKNMLHHKDFDFNPLDTVTLCKLLTTIIRTDRFNDGFLVSYFKNGIVLKIIKAIKQNESQRH